MAYLDPIQGAIREGDIPPMDPAAAVADQAALTGAPAAGAAPVKAEFDAVVADAVAARTKLNALLASLRAAGYLDV